MKEQEQKYLEKHGEPIHNTIDEHLQTMLREGDGQAIVYLMGQLRAMLNMLHNKLPGGAEATTIFIEPEEQTKH
jgi:hypothetical protein